MNFQDPANRLFFALFIFLKPSAVFDMADHEALYNGLQNPGVLTSNNNLFFALYLASPCGGRGRVSRRTLGQDAHAASSPLPRLDLSTEAASPSPSLHSPSHTDYTQHILILSLSHMSHVRLWMSQATDYSPCRTLVLN